MTTSEAAESKNEQLIEHELSKIPISIWNDTYILAAAILSYPGVWDKDVRHFTAAIKLNQNWEIYDDIKQKPEEVSSRKSFAIRALFYLKRERQRNEETTSARRSTRKKK